MSYRQGRDNGGRKERRGDCVIANCGGVPVRKDTIRRLVWGINIDAASTLITDAESHVV